MLFAALATLVGTVLARSFDTVDFANQIFGSFVAVTGDAHQSKVAQDIFRQQIKYERSLQIREDIRDVNKMMLESVQTHLFMGSIFLGVCFCVLIEGSYPEGTHRFIADLWMIFAAWSATFTLLSLWLALCFQAKISCCARERLLRKHRTQMPDDNVVGKMGGDNLVDGMAALHTRVLQLFLRARASIYQQVSTPAPTSDAPTSDHAAPAVDDDVPECKDDEFEDYDAPIRLHSKVSTAESSRGRAVVGPFGPGELDTESVRKGMLAWRHTSGFGLSRHTILDLPSFLVGETLIRSRWFFSGQNTLAFNVYEPEATLYVAALCPPLHLDAKDKKVGNIEHYNQGPDWPASELPMVIEGAHESWKNAAGLGEFQRVNGFSIFVGKASVELPLYKMVLEAADVATGTTCVEIDWRFHRGCEGLLVIVRQGHIHCKEEDWPIVEFNEEIKRIMPLRDYSGLFMRRGVFCLITSAFLTSVARLWPVERMYWWFENILNFIAMIPALLALFLIPIYQTGASITTNVPLNKPTQKFDHVSYPVTPRVGTPKPDYRHDGHVFQPDAHELDELPASGSVVNGSGHVAGTNSGQETPCLADQLRTDFDAPMTAGSVSNSDATAVPQELMQQQQQQQPQQQQQQTLAGDSIGTTDLHGSSWAAGRDDFLSEGHLWCRPPQLAKCGDVVRLVPLKLEEAVGDGSHICGNLPELAKCKQVVVGRQSSLPIEPRHEAEQPIYMSSACPDPTSESGGSEDKVKRSQARHVVAQVLRRLPTELKPIDMDNTLRTGEGVTQPFEATLRKFRIWTNVLHILFVGSLVMACIANFIPTSISHEDERLDQPVVAVDEKSLQWTELQVTWPPYFHPSAAAMTHVGAGSNMLWVAAGQVIRAFSSSSGAGDLGSTVLESDSSAMVIPTPISGIGVARAEFLTVSHDLLLEFDLATTDPNSTSALPSLPTAVEVLPRSRRRLPDFAVAGMSVQAAAVLLPLVDGGGNAAQPLVAVAVETLLSGADPGHLQRGVVQLYEAANSSTGTQMIRQVGVVRPSVGQVTALHGCPAGICSAEPILWVAGNGGMLAIGLRSGSELASYVLPSLSSGATDVVVALASNVSHLLAIMSGEGHRPRIFVTPHPALPSGQAPPREL